MLGVLILFLPPLLYRWSLKATAIIYSPLLWLVSFTFKGETKFTEHLRIWRSSNMEMVIVLYSALVMFGFACKVTIYGHWNLWAAWWNNSGFALVWNASPMGRLVDAYIQPRAIPLWQIAMCFNALLAVFLHYFIDAALRRQECELPWKESTIRRVVRSTRFVRGCLTVLYILPCTLWLLWHQQWGWSFPPILPKWFPWS